MRKAGAIILLTLALAVAGVTSMPAKAAPTPEQLALDQRYETDMATKVEEPHQAALRRLNESYRVTLETAFKKTAAEGQLEQTLALQKESKRFAESSTVPEKDEPGATAEVAKLRSAWRAEAARLAKVRAAALQPVQEAYLASLRTLEKELTRALKLDEATEVRAKITALSPAPATAGPPAPAFAAAVPPPANTANGAPATLTVVPFARPAERATLYASGNNKSIIFHNGKEVMNGVDRNEFTKAAVGLKAGDVIAILQNGRPSDNFIWLSAISLSGDFLFETGLDWKCYQPKNAAKWWDIKNIQTEQPAPYFEAENNYRDLVKRAATATPLYHGTLPIRSVLQVGDRHQPMYFYHVLTGQDLLPKKLPAETVFSDPGLTWVGKMVRIKLTKAGDRALVIERSQPTTAPYNAALGGAALFKIVRGTRPGTVAFETQTKRGTYLRGEGDRVHLLDKFGEQVEFCLERPVSGQEGVSIALAKIPRFHLFSSDREPLGLSDKVQDDTAVFYFEEVRLK
jgi:hypothetical protein